MLIVTTLISGLSIITFLILLSAVFMDHYPNLSDICQGLAGMAILLTLLAIPLAAGL